jgi:hypothetical protein
MDCVRTTENSGAALIVTVMCWRRAKERGMDLKLALQVG